MLRTIILSKFVVRAQFITNRGAAVIAPVYTLEVNNHNYLRVDQSWNWQVQSVNGDGTAIGTVGEVKPLSHIGTSGWIVDPKGSSASNMCWSRIEELSLVTVCKHSAKTPA